MKKAKVVSFVAVCGLMLNFQAGAAPLNLPAPTATQPDFEDAPLDVVYNSGVFGVTNRNGDDYDWDYINGAGSSLMSSEQISYLTANINSSGDLTSGIFDLYGNIGSGNELLLSGNLVTGNSGTAWGYDDGGNNPDLFSFEFQITGGASVVVSDFGGMGAIDGVSLTANFSGNSPNDNPFGGTWSSSGFNNLIDNGAGTGQGYDDIYEVPEPSSLTLVSAVACLLALAPIYRRKPKARPARVRAKK